jgi:XTP/dITP diphosphohydrolase/tetrapyrrole methylase family protein/MazG family protein/ATP diphosphatase
VSRDDIEQAIGRLDDLARRLRKECPWDREQDERSIVPHTVEEAYELADAAERGDDAKLLDELGDVLFQVHFLSLLLEERGAGNLAQVADGIHAKLVRRHPHVFGSEAGRSPAGGERPEADPASQTAGQDAPRRTSWTSQDVLRNWDEIKRGEPGREGGIFGDVPGNLPGPLYARKVQRRAASTGFDFPGVEGPLQSVRDEADEVARVDGRDEAFHEVGDLLFAAVNVARKLRVDPELALRAASDRFRGRVDAAAGMAAAEGRRWEDLDPDAQLQYYARIRLME